MPDSQAEFWSEYLKRDISFLSRGHNKNSFFCDLFETCKEFMEPMRGGKVLEIGCGDGMDSIALALNYDCKVTAIDISSIRVELAQQNVKKFRVEERVRVIFGDAHSLDFKEGEFDCVLGNSVMLFLDHDRVCKEVARVLRTGGRFILSNESMATSLLVKLSRKFGIGYRSKDLEKHTKVRLSPTKIRELGSNYFTHVSSVPHFGLLMQLMWGARLLYDRVINALKSVDTYNKPDIVCPPLLKRIDRYLIDRWNFYRDRTWISAVCFIK